MCKASHRRHTCTATSLFAAPRITRHLTLGAKLDKCDKLLPSACIGIREQANCSPCDNIAFYRSQLTPTTLYRSPDRPILPRPCRAETPDLAPITALEEASTLLVSSLAGSSSRTDPARSH